MDVWEYDYLYKVIVVGESGVGKSSLVSRYVNDEFRHDFMMTIGVDFAIKEIDSYKSRIKLQIWDTSGQERFTPIVVQYFRGAHIVLLVYDVTNEDSLDVIREKWLPRAQDLVREHAHFVLAGNKADRNYDPDIVAKAEEWANEVGIPHYIISAKTAANVNKAVEESVDRFTSDVVMKGGEGKKSILKPNPRGRAGIQLSNPESQGAPRSWTSFCSIL